MQALDKISFLFLSLHKSEVIRAWDVLCKHFRCVKRPQLHELIDNGKGRKEKPEQILQ